MEPTLKFSPTELISAINQTLDYAYSSVVLVGEVASFKVNQGKWVFFDIKDDESSVNCFMTLYQLKMPLEDGMKVMVRGVPKITKWGKFSFTVQAIQPVGEGSIKKAFELLKKKLAAEGLFDEAKKRPLPTDISSIGVISSTQAAGYADFIKIINERWGGLKITTAHTQVQGLDAPAQIVRAIKYFNEHGSVDVIAIIRGGGSADDLAAFNDEELVRAIAASKIPVITGIGHEVDESLADLAADVRASTPSNAAQMLTKDRAAEIRKIETTLDRVKQVIINNINNAIFENKNKVERITREWQNKVAALTENVKQKMKLLEALNPEKVLRQGYAILSGKVSPGSVVKITTFKQEINAEIKDVRDRQ